MPNNVKVFLIPASTKNIRTAVSHAGSQTLFPKSLNTWLHPAECLVLTLSDMLAMVVYTRNHVL